MEQEPKPTLTVERLIALKRYEQPPPGYFHLLPGRILHRIEHGAGRSRFREKLRLSFSARPALAFGLGLAFCGALIAAIIYSPAKMDNSAATDDLTLGQQWAAVSSPSSPSLTAADTSPGESGWLGSTNPVTAPKTSDSLFTPPEARAIPVSLYQQN
jgi:hypothetical protein